MCDLKLVISIHAEFEGYLMSVKKYVVNVCVKNEFTMAIYYEIGVAN
ncbi:hypothetical protein [Clostridium estertheticum]|nr:hypothetical protein [Clostridium estertheticum]MBX4267237.1 hypothetical protein [Clostridium estertheticum]WLC91243.1 hypothetical protein KTC95_23590 [Clostridium estertheticum]